jgi:hypothetical protein
MLEKLFNEETLGFVVIKFLTFLFGNKTAWLGEDMSNFLIFIVLFKNSLELSLILLKILDSGLNLVLLTKGEVEVKKLLFFLLKKDRNTLGIIFLSESLLRRFKNSTYEDVLLFFKKKVSGVFLKKKECKMLSFA